ncbi:MAG: M20/M25/M40 family metallo-hydrolase [Planctomycetota bacterium]|jgi:acetylornithine deacetylase/succinyl-diaminopimelate desuccinylase-like protein
MAPMAFADVRKSIDANREKELERLFRIVRIPSVAAQNKGIKEASAFLHKELKDLGFSVRAWDGGGNPVLMAERKGPPGSKTLLFYDHYDVQPEDPLDKWESPPFEPAVRDGRIFARGVADNKGNLMARIAAVRAWVDATGSVPCTVRFVFEGEEEIGSPSLPRFTEENAAFLKSDLTIWEAAYRDAAGRPEIILGCKGIAHGQLECRTADTDIHSGRGGILPSAAWRLVWALAAIKGPDDRILVDGFHDECVVPGPNELEFLRKMPFEEKGFLKQVGARAYIRNLTGFDLVKHHFYQPTFTINGFDCGYSGEGSKTVLPSHGIAKFDIRLVPDMKPETVEQRIRAHLDKHGFQDVALAHFRGYPAARTPFDHPTVKLVHEAGRGLWDEEFVILPHMPMSGPMYLFRSHAPCIGIGVGHAESNNHAPNESIFVEDFHRGTAHAARLLEMMSHG